MDLLKELGTALKPEKNYFSEVAKIEINAKIEYRKMCEVSGHNYSDFGEKAYLHGYMSAKLASALRDIDKLKNEIEL